MLSPVWLQIALFPELVESAPINPHPTGHIVSDDERDRRTSGQWLRAVRAYLEFGSGDAWRRGSDRNNPARIWYVNGIRCLNSIGCENSFPRLAVQPSHKTALEIRVAALAARPASRLVDELMKLRPELTMRKTLMHFTRLKLAGLVIEARRNAKELTLMQYTRPVLAQLVMEARDQTKEALRQTA